MKSRENSGFTVLELMVVVTIIAILSTTALYNIRTVNSPIINASESIEHYLHLARSRAISGTEVIQISASSATRLVSSTSTSCTGTMTADPRFFLDLPSESSLTDQTTTVCFTQRGLVAASAAFHVIDTEGQTADIKVALGGGTAIDY